MLLEGCETGSQTGFFFIYPEWICSSSSWDRYHTQSSIWLLDKDLLVTVGFSSLAAS